MSTKAKLLTAAAILKVQDIRTEELSVPEWGGCVIVRGLTGADRDALEMETFEDRQKGKTPNTRARMAARCLVDEKGAPLFSKQDVLKLGLKSSQALDRIVEKAQELSGLSADDLDEMEANFTDDPSGDSTSD